jgi:hypothetical protein
MKEFVLRIVVKPIPAKRFLKCIGRMVDVVPLSNLRQRTNLL